MSSKLILAILALVGCGSSASDTPPPAAAASPKPIAAPAETAAPNQEQPAPVKGSSEPSEDKLRASKALEEPFPEIEKVTKEIGKPFATGKATRRAWYFEKQPLGKTFSCDTIDLIRAPSGRVVVSLSVFTSDDCKTVKPAKRDVVAVLATLAGEPAPSDPELQLMAENVQTKKFDEASALFENKLGKPRSAGEPDFAAWRYRDGEGECRVLLLTSRLGSGASQAIWGLSCE